MLYDPNDDLDFGPGKIRWRWWAGTMGFIALGYVAVAAWMMKMATGVPWLELAKGNF